MFHNNIIGIPSFRYSLKEGSPFTLKECKTSAGRLPPSPSPSNSALSTERYSVVSLGKRSIKIWLISLIKEFRMVRIKRLRKKLGSILDLASDIYGYTLSIKLRKYLERLTNGGNSIIPLYLGS